MLQNESYQSIWANDTQPQRNSSSAQAESQLYLNSTSTTNQTRHQLNFSKTTLEPNRDHSSLESHSLSLIFFSLLFLVWMSSELITSYGSSLYWTTSCCCCKSIWIEVRNNLPLAFFLFVSLNIKYIYVLASEFVVLK